MRWSECILALNIPDFIHGLLNHAGSDIDLHLLIDKIRNELRIPGLRDSLCKLMQDHNIQVDVDGHTRRYDRQIRS